MRMMVGMLALMAGGSMAAGQTGPATTQGTGQGARIRPPRVITPEMKQDEQTGQYYTPMVHNWRERYAIGADISSSKDLEEKGKLFRDDDGQAKPLLQILGNHGYTWVRLRTCVEPATLPQTTAYTVAYAKEAKKRGFRVLLDIHYSNGWADPTNEPTPREWQNLPHAELVKKLFEYTRETTAALADADALPEIIQVGNEVSNGFLWPNAKLPEHWDDFADLLAAGINGVDAGRGNHARPRIMIHVDHGGDMEKTKAFFDKVNGYHIPFDMIGFSFYPWSHGTLLDLKENLAFAAETYRKDIMVVETGYYYAKNTASHFDVTPGPFPETPEGQAQWLTAVNEVVMNVPGGRGVGVFWWEPASGRGLVARGYFDGEGNAQPVLRAMDGWSRPVHRTDSQ